MKIDHIGYLTGVIDATANAFADLGYAKSEVYADPIQKCYICFLTCPGNDRIELVQPFDDNHPMQRMLKKRGAGVYHICYEVTDVQKLFDSLSQKEGWTPLFAPVEALAFNNRLITYFLNAETGFVEFVNSK